MKRHLIRFLIGTVLLSVLACAGGNPADAIAGKTFVREGGGCGGDFTVTLHTDGTYEYYEGFLSSYIGRGDWTVEDGTLTMVERGGYDSVFRFSVANGELRYRAEDSDGFLYVDVADGDRFLPLD